METNERPIPPGFLKELNFAVSTGNGDMVKCLLRSGGSINARDSEGQTALHWACRLLSEKENRSGQMQRIIDVLFRSRADVNVLDKNGRTPLHEACLYKDESVVIALLRNGAKIDLVDNRGDSPLHNALEYWNSCDDDILPVVKALLDDNKSGGSKERGQNLSDHRADKDFLYVLNLKGKFGKTPLHIASQRNIKDVACFLLRMGAEVGIKDSAGMTAFDVACISLSLDVVNVLVDNGAAINEKGNGVVELLQLVCILLPSCEPVEILIKIIDYLLNVGVQKRKDCLESSYQLISPWQNVETKNKIEETYIKHAVNMEMSNPQLGFDIKWNMGLDFCNSVRYQCCQELEDMKSTNVVKNVSAYQVLSQTKPYDILSTDDILDIDEFLCSPDLLIRYPLYGLSLRVTFQRPKLMTLAVQSFYTEWRKQTEKELPSLVTEQLLSYLTNEDLRNFIRSESCERVNRSLISFNL